MISHADVGRAQLLDERRQRARADDGGAVVRLVREVADRDRRLLRSPAAARRGWVRNHICHRVGDDRARGAVVAAAVDAVVAGALAKQLVGVASAVDGWPQ